MVLKLFYQAPSFDANFLKDYLTLVKYNKYCDVRVYITWGFRMRLIRIELRFSLCSTLETL